MGVREQDSYDLSLVTPTLLIWALDYQILQGINAITISIGTLGLIIILIRLVNRTIQKRPKHSERLGNNIHLLLIATVILSVLNLTAAHLRKNRPATPAHLDQMSQPLHPGSTSYEKCGPRERLQKHSHQVHSASFPNQPPTHRTKTQRNKTRRL